MAGLLARRPPLPAKACGFTLIELLVAIGVMALLAILSWRGLDGMTRAQAYTQERADQVLGLEVGLAQWGADLEAIQRMPQIPEILTLDWDGRALRMTRRDATDAAGGLRVVAWTLRTVDGSGRWLRWQSEPVLTRSAWRAAWGQAGLWAQTPGTEERRREVVVAPITEWQIFYFRGEALTNPLSSAGAALPAGGLDGPDGVRLMLTLPEGHPMAGRLVRDWVRPDLSGNKS